MFDVIMGIIRHALTFGGGYLVTSGIATQGQTEAIIGGVVTAIGVIWSVLHKKKITPA